MLRGVWREVRDSLESEELEQLCYRRGGRWAGWQESVAAEQSRAQGLEWASERNEAFGAREPTSVWDKFSKSSFMEHFQQGKMGLLEANRLFPPPPVCQTPSPLFPVALSATSWGVNLLGVLPAV